MALSAWSADAQQIELQINDLTPKFEAFYAQASKPDVTEAQRWDLWNKMYGFAAVPPTPKGEQMARSMLDQAWPRFAAAMPVIREGANAIQPPPRQSLKDVARLLGADVPIRARLVVAVGDFEGNAFTSPGKDGVPTVSVEVEDPNAGTLALHEFTHVVEAEQAGLSLEWKRSIAHTIFAEGLAMRTVQALRPGKPDASYVGEMSPHWFARCTSARQKILADLEPHLASSDPDLVMKYTMGNGGLGLEREAYYAGWLVIGDLLQHGWSFPRLARVPDAQMPAIVRDSIQRLSRK